MFAFSVGNSDEVTKAIADFGLVSFDVVSFMVQITNTSFVLWPIQVHTNPQECMNLLCLSLIPCFCCYEDRIYEFS